MRAGYWPSISRNRLTKDRSFDIVRLMDWQSLIASIQKRGLSQVQIASICGCGQPTISDLSKGHTVEPRFALGQQLIVLSKASDREVRRLLARSESKQEA